MRKNGKLSTYRKFKYSFKFEKYLDVIKDYKSRTAMTAFRISSHRLEIETYRYSKTYIPRNERLCTVCSQDRLFYVGDELHALLECKKIQGCRNEILEILRNECKSIANMNVTEQFIYIMSYEGPLGAVSIRKTVLPGMAIPMSKIRRPNGRLIFNMEIAIRR